MFWHTLFFLLWKIIGMKNKTILLLAVGDGAINIVEQNKEKFPDEVEIVSIRVVQGDVDDVDAPEYWAKMLQLIVSDEIMVVSVLNCLGGDSRGIVLPICKALSEYKNSIFLEGWFIYPFSFEGNSCFLNAQSKISLLEDEENFKSSYFEVTTICNDDMFAEFPQLPFHAALRQFNGEICNEILSLYMDFL